MLVNVAAYKALRILVLFKFFTPFAETPLNFKKNAYKK